MMQIGRMSVLGALWLWVCVALPVRAEALIDVWLDVDTANAVGDVDDGVMMIQALREPTLNVRGVSVQFGNSTLDRAVPIARHILDRFGDPTMPVHAGAAGADDFGQPSDAVDAMAEALREAPMTILAVGPVTNVGTLVQQHPELHERIEAIVMVAARRPGQKFVVSEQQPAPFRDANFEKDVPAMQAILDSDIPLVFAPWEVSCDVWLTEADLDALHNTGGAGAWIADTSRYWSARWRAGMDVDGFTPFDTLAVGWLTHPELIASMPVVVAIEMGPDDGARPVDRQAGQDKPYLHVQPADANDARAIYTYKADPAFKQVLLEQLAGQDTDRYTAGGQHGNTFDHAVFDLLTRVYVSDEGLVDYAGLRRNPQTLATYLHQLASADLDALTDDERLALLINAYNAFTLQLIVEHPDIASIKDIPEDKRWKHVRWDLGGQTVSLDQVEHEMIRKQFDEPRIHWALVCAAFDCPPLRRGAFDAADLDAQLAEQTRRVHSSDRYVVHDPASGTLSLTPLYKWYGLDFGQGELEAVVIRTVSQHVPGLNPTDTPRIEWNPYDWALNLQPATPQE